ncbi:TPA: radical SAM protein [Candidatus Avigastranaerophilus faecigallinarum]|nr:radical SAM protein [Candidatus Avigastranaerophilus faecigallinarum]
MRYKSCYWIESGINFDIDTYKICCLYSAKGGGNTIVKNNYKGEPIDWDNFFNFKKRIKDLHKSGKIYPKCEGCILLEERDWPDDHTKISMINLDYWTKCNSRCSYCHTMNDKEAYNKFKNYNFLPILKDMIKRDILRPHGHVSFGGGEVTLLKEFDKLLNIFMDYGFPLTRIHSSCIKYSRAIEKGLKNGRVDLIVSIDAGSKEMHEKVKQVKSYDKVWKNLKRYASNQRNPLAVKVKYIVIPGLNDDKKEIELWLKKAKENGINCVLQEIESKWFYARRDNVPDEIIDFFNYTKEKAENLGLKYELYERAEHMMKFKKEKKGA